MKRLLFFSFLLFSIYTKGQVWDWALPGKGQYTNLIGASGKYIYLSTFSDSLSHFGDFTLNSDSVKQFIFRIDTNGTVVNKSRLNGECLVDQYDHIYCLDNGQLIAYSKDFALRWSKTVKPVVNFIVTKTGKVLIREQVQDQNESRSSITLLDSLGNNLWTRKDPSWGGIYLDEDENLYLVGVCGDTTRIGTDTTLYFQSQYIYPYYFYQLDVNGKFKGAQILRGYYKSYGIYDFNANHYFINQIDMYGGIEIASYNYSGTNEYSIYDDYSQSLYIQSKETSLYVAGYGVKYLNDSSKFTCRTNGRNFVFLSKLNLKGLPVQSIEIPSMYDYGNGFKFAFTKFIFLGKSMFVLGMVKNDTIEINSTKIESPINNFFLAKTNYFHRDCSSEAASIDTVGLLCENSSPITLKATPSGGIFTGPGVSGNKFFPFAAGLGAHGISYSIKGKDGCNSSAKITIEVKNCTGINKLKNLELLISPNPTSGIINIAFQEKSKGFVRISDMTGKLVMFQEIDQTERTSLNMSGESAGIYTLDVFLNNQVIHRKLVLTQN